jgi:hypothetical protein
MIPLLAQLGIALVGGIMQKKEQEAALANARHQHAGQIEMDIAAKRAARAGDSGYMQQALGGAAQMPKRPPSVFPGVVAGMGTALLGYNGGSGAAAEAVSGADRAAYEAAKSGESLGGLPSKYAGLDWDDTEDKWGGYA